MARLSQFVPAADSTDTTVEEEDGNVAALLSPVLHRVEAAVPTDSPTSLRLSSRQGAQPYRPNPTQPRDFLQRFIAHHSIGATVCLRKGTSTSPPRSKIETLEAWQVIYIFRSRTTTKSVRRLPWEEVSCALSEAARRTRTP